jgi:hypothetical protein
MKFCSAPDRDVPRLRCGFPMPCPYHTEAGARKVRMLIELGKPQRPAPLLILGVTVGPQWYAVCEKFLR